MVPGRIAAVRSVSRSGGNERIAADTFNFDRPCTLAIRLIGIGAACFGVHTEWANSSTRMASQDNRRTRCVAICDAGIDAKAALACFAETFAGDTSPRRSRSLRSCAIGYAASSSVVLERGGDRRDSAHATASPQRYSLGLPYGR